MSSSDPLQRKKEFYSDFVYKYLISLTRAEDVSLTFYGISPQNQKFTEQSLLRMADNIAEKLVEDWAKITNNGIRSLTDLEKEKLVRTALKLAEEKLNGKREDK